MDLEKTEIKNLSSTTNPFPFCIFVHATFFPFEISKLVFSIFGSQALNKARA